MPKPHLRPLALTLALAAALANGCATTDDASSAGKISITLQAGPRNAGEVGRALLAAQGDKTAVMLTLSGVPPWLSRPVQLYTFVYAGSCPAHDTTPTYSMNEVVNAGLFSNNPITGPFVLQKLVPAPTETLRAGAYVLVVASTAADGNVELFCGAI